VTDGDLLAKFKACDPLDAFVPPRQVGKERGERRVYVHIYYIIWVYVCACVSIYVCV
jgi:hypothetical protein